MELPPLTAGRFVRRDNRFRVTVRVAGEPVGAHLPNSGRLTELLTPGRLCWLAGFDNPRRKTRFDLRLVAYAGTLVSVDARLPNSLFAETVAKGRLEPFRRYACFEREVQYGESRLDFRLEGLESVCWVEVKSVSLVEGRRALFPDAPTSRGARHVRELTEIVCQGERAAVLFLLQRADADVFSPHEERDPEFARALREAVDQGVEAYAYRSWVSPAEIRLLDAIPVDL